MEEFKIGDPILYRVKNDKTAVWYPSIYLGIGLNGCTYLPGGSFLRSEEFTIVPLTEDTMQYICTNLDIRVPWKPKPGELVAVKNAFDDCWKARVYVQIGVDEKYWCSNSNFKDDTRDIAGWDQCEPIYKHFNVPSTPDNK